MQYMYLHLRPLVFRALARSTPKGNVYFWQHESEKERDLSISTHGMKSRVLFKWRLNPRRCLPFREETFHRVRLCTRSLAKKPVSFPSLWLCVCHRLNLHSIDDVPFSEAPFRDHPGCSYPGWDTGNHGNACRRWQLGEEKKTKTFSRRQKSERRFSISPGSPWGGSPGSPKQYVHKILNCA